MGNSLRSSNDTYPKSTPSVLEPETRKVNAAEFPVFKTKPIKDLAEGYVLSAGYDGDRRAVYLRLYESKTRRIHFWYDNTKHLPYCLSDIPPEELKKVSNLVNHPGLDHIETVEKHDPLQDKKVNMSKIVAKDPLSIGGRFSGTIRDIVSKAWEADIRYYNCYIYDRQILLGMPYSIKDGDLVSIPLEIPDEVLAELGKAFSGEAEEFKEYIDHWVSLLQTPIPSIRRVAIDIEVLASVQNRVPDPLEARDPIVAASIVDSDGAERVLLLRRTGMGEGPERASEAQVAYFDNEVGLIAEIYQVLLDYPVVLTFNGDDFDISYLYHRGLNLGFSRESIPIVVGARECLMKYGIHLDLYKFFFNRSIQISAFSAQYTDMSLNGVSEALLDEGKDDLGATIADMSYNTLASYCLKDSQLTLRLTTFNEDLVMKLIMVLIRITKLPMEDLVRQGVSGWIKNMMYFEHRRLNYLLPRSEDIIATKGEVVS
ncbi:type B DNA-directed DNA polymerase, partial [Candidatus Bathyarchaeota archaeon]|nr:type B DNA-directed DNA polymerase [Candidatus Bathyarchaeota archaeon]